MRLLALAEVVVACGLCHLTYRALQQTPLGEYERAVGRSFLPGAVLIAFALAALWVQQQRFEVSGVTCRQWPFAVFVGLLGTLLFTVIGGGLVVLGLSRTDLLGISAQALGWLVGTLVLLGLWNRHPALTLPAFPGRWATRLGVGFLLCVLAFPCLGGLGSGQRLLTTGWSVLWLFACTGFGEELFFRGYVQSRLNWPFGRPYRWLGMAFGPGLILTALLFGAMHVLNGVDYFQGRFEWAWGSGVVSVCAGLYYGCLRETTGSIVAGGIAHGLAGVMTEVPRAWSAS